MKHVGPFSRMRLSAACAVLLVCGVTFAQADKKPPVTPKKSSTKTPVSPVRKASRKGKKSRKATASWRRGQQKIDRQRAQEIQEALIREHYLDGKASGVWDAASQQAMERYQVDNGWQSKTVPDARALIKLGLGPDHGHLLNPESAMTSPRQAPNTMPPSAPTVAPDPLADKNPPQK